MSSSAGEATQTESCETPAASQAGDARAASDASGGGYPFSARCHIAEREVVAATRLCYATVNLMPIVPGHLLVMPQQVFERVADMDERVFCDLWVLAKKIGELVQAEYNATSLTFAIQDGPHAGQTVKHVHIHVIPRKEGDFAFNDQVYKEMESPSPARKPRNRSEMVVEAQHLKRQFDARFSSA